MKISMFCSTYSDNKYAYNFSAFEKPENYIRRKFTLLVPSSYYIYQSQSKYGEYTVSTTMQPDSSGLLFCIETFVDK